MIYPNPDFFVFTTNSDKTGNSYFNCYSNVITNCNLVLNDKNIVFSGKPKLFVRTENKHFEKEFVFSFLIETKKHEYNVNSEHQVIEFYLPVEKGIEFLEQSLAYLKSKLNQKGVSNDRN